MKAIYALLWRILVRSNAQGISIKGLGDVKHLSKNTDGDLVIIVDGDNKL